MFGDGGMVGVVYVDHSKVEFVEEGKGNLFISEMFR